MRAILISAGKGTRLYPLTKNTPKCLIQFGNGETILENQINTLKKCGIKDISIITGYLTEQIEAKIKIYKDLNIEVIYNPFYDETNNLYSLWMARNRLNEDVITINGDDIFTEEVIVKLREFTGDIVMCVSESNEYDEDDMKVVIEDGSVIKVGKDLDINITSAESVGMIKMSARGANILKETLDMMVKSGEYRNDFYLKALQNIMDRKIQVDYVKIEQSQWQEMDFHADLELINKLMESKYKKIKF